MTPAAPRGCVVDASVGFKLFVAESLSDAAHALFAGLARDPPARLYVPDLFTIECTAILWRYGMRLGLSQPDAHRFVAQLGQLRLLSFPTETRLSDALDIALAHDITAYDELCSVEEANGWLQELMDQGYRSPAGDLRKLLRA